jgi:secreted PhoX family phosphatase
MSSDETHVERTSNMDHREKSVVNRRTVLRGAGSMIASTTLAGALHGLMVGNARAAGEPTTPVGGPFGPVAPVADRATGLPLLQLPTGFSYSSLGWTGDRMTDGQPTPPNHDGMGVVSMRGGSQVVLVRNHENTTGRHFVNGLANYDTVRDFRGKFASGATTNLVIENGRIVKSYASLGGTSGNCAGGPTPWGSWLTCEEHTSLDRSFYGGKVHGFVFEVPGEGAPSGQPITAMGRFSHEAAAVDPETSIVYLTEDNRKASGFYRFIPNDRRRRIGALEQGGKLQMLKIRQEENKNLRRPSMGDVLDVEWVDIPEPAAAPQGANIGGNFVRSASAPFLQGFAEGAARFRRGEGCWYGNRKIYFTDTEAGPVGKGAIWAYDIKNEKLALLFLSGATAAGNNPDNVTVSPFGDIFFGEDGGGQALRMMGLLPGGNTFEFARNNIVLDNADITKAGRTGQIRRGDYRREEWTGLTFAPDGKTAFVNIQRPGITFVINGPFAKMSGTA